MTEFVTHRGFLIPEADRECRKVVFDTTGDMDLALQHVRQFKLAFQAGGNFGVWPAHLADRFSRVVTCEPDIDNFHCLKQNVPKNVECIRAAVGDGIGVASMKRDPKNAGAHYIDHKPDEKISVITIDSLNLGALDYLCLDIEGYEMLALRGAWKTLRKFKPVIQIEDKGLSEKYGYAKGDAERWLKNEFGYEVKHRVHRDVILV